MATRGIANVRGQFTGGVFGELRRQPAVDLFDREERLPAADLFGIAVKRGRPTFEFATAAFNTSGSIWRRLPVERTNLRAA